MEAKHLQESIEQKILEIIIKSTHEKEVQLKIIYDEFEELKKDSLDKIAQLEKFEELHRETLINIFPEYANNHRRSGFLGLPINDLLHRFLEQDHLSAIKHKKQELGIDTPDEFSCIVTHQNFCDTLGISLHTLKKYLDLFKTKGILEKKQVIGGICYKINQRG